MTTTLGSAPARHIAPGKDLATVRPHVLQVLHTLDTGGAEVLAAALARQLVDRVRFSFLCLDELGVIGDRLRSEGFPVEVLGRRPGLDRRCLARLARLVRSDCFDMVHAHQYTPTSYALLARWPRSGPPLIFHEHGRHLPDYRRWKRVAANRFLFRAGDRVVAVGEAVRDAVVRNDGLPASSVKIIYNGIALDRFAPDRLASARPSIRAGLGIGPDSLVLIQVARLDYLKDHLTAIQMMTEVIRDRPDCHLLVVGDGPERGCIEEAIRRFGLGARVHLLGSRDDVPALLAASDIAILTSLNEGIPLTLIEAMAASRPVVATAVGGVPEVVVHGETGLLVPPRSPDDLAREILGLARDRETRERLAHAGRRRAEERFDQSRMHEEFLALYLEQARR